MVQAARIGFSAFDHFASSSSISVAPSTIGWVGSKTPSFTRLVTSGIGTLSGIGMTRRLVSRRRSLYTARRPPEMPP